MKFLQRYLCVLLCCVLLLGVFSVNASAEELDVKPYHVYATSYLVYGDVIWDLYGSAVFNPGNGVEENQENTLYLNASHYNSHNGNMYNLIVYDVAYDDQTTMFLKDIKTTVKMENIFYRYLLLCTICPTTKYYFEPSTVTAKVKYIDGTEEYVSTDFTVSNGDIDIKFTLTPRADVKAISFNIATPIPHSSHVGHIDSVRSISYLGEYGGDDKYTLTINQPSEEAGLLEGIWGSISSGFDFIGEKVTGVIDSVSNGFKDIGTKLNNVWTSITDGFTNLGNKLTSVIDSILELPRKLWQLIEDGLKSLFVPDDESFAEMKSNFDDLLSDKFGALYQVGSIVVSFWENILIADERNAIDIPEVEIPIGPDKTFVFGGYSIQIVPDGFSPIAFTCKLITSIVATFMFMNALKRKYEELLHT